jgi:glycosyltransferase involved in cell wall biosynthesis
VDDNSDKDIPRLKDVECQFPNVEFVFAKNENGRRGAGYARNLGLERVEGKWLIFADADDFFLPDFEKALDEYKDNENEIIYFFLNSVDSETLQPAQRADYFNNFLKKIQQSNDWDIALNIKTVWAKFIKNDLVRQNAISFQEVPNNDDVIFSSKLTVSTTKKTLSDYVLYCVTDRQGSLMTDQTIDTQILRFNVACQAFELLKPYGKAKFEKSTVETMWIIIFALNPFQAVLLFPKIVKTCGLRYSLSILRRHIMRYIKWLMHKIA